MSTAWNRAIAATRRVGAAFICPTLRPRLRAASWAPGLVLVVLLGLHFLPGQERAPLSGQAQQYYVCSTWGSDRNPGTTAWRPWRTLGPLHARQLRPGDVVNLARGSTWDEGLVISHSGSPRKPITIRAYGIGPPPVLRSLGRTDAVSLKASWVVLKGLRVEGAGLAGIRIAEGAQHNVVEGNEISETGFGVSVYGQFNLITRNWIHDLRMVVDTPEPADDDYGAVGVGLFGSHNEISFNRLARCSAPSHDYGTDGGAFEVFGNVTGDYIHHNWAIRNRGFLEVGGGSATDIVVSFNHSIDNGEFTVIHLEGRFASTVSHLYVDNNTIVERGAGAQLLGFEGEPDAETLVFRNNVVWLGDYERVANEAGYYHARNDYHLAQASTELGFALGPGETLADPPLVDFDTRTLQLHPMSAAWRSGIPGLSPLCGTALDVPPFQPDMGASPRCGARE